jgi:uncharacterized protein YdgA (DUF945 family)
LIRTGTGETMKKIYYGLIAVCAAFLLIMVLAPYIIGYTIAHKYSDTLSAIASSTKLNIKPLNYQRHWFQSEVSVLVNLPLSEQPINTQSLSSDKDYVITLQQRIIHGPIVFYKDTNSGHWIFKLALASIVSTMPEQPGLSAQTTIKLNGDALTKLRIQNFSHISPLTRRSIYQIKNLMADIHLNAAMNHFSCNLTADSLETLINNPRHIQQLYIHYDLNKRKELWLGKELLEIGSMTWYQDTKPFSLNKLHHEINSLSHNDRIDATIHSEVQGININGNNYGDQKFLMTANKIDLPSFIQLKQFLTDQNPSFTQSHRDVIGQLLCNVLSKGAQLEIKNLSLNTAWGQVNAQANFNFSAGDLTANVQQLPHRLTAIVNMKIPMELTSYIVSSYYLLHSEQQQVAEEKTKQQISEWLKNGWLENRGSEYQMHLKWEHQKLNKNLVQ